ncbi:MAG TPA: sensor histidine kinase, partial [Herpetosiphonaceae bacterium]
LATLLVGSMAWLESRGLLPEREPLPEILVRVAPLLGVAFWVMMFWTIAALTSLLAGNLQRALQQSRAQAQDLAALSQELEGRVAAQTAELATRTARAEALYEVTRALTSTLDLPEVLALIAEQAAQLLKFRSSQVLLDQPERGGFTLVGSYNLGAGAGNSLGAGPFDDDDEEALRQALEGRQPLTLALAETSALVLPMHHTNQVAGLLVLLDPREAAPPGPDDLALAAQLADQAAVAVANAQLLARSRESATVEERARLAREIHDTLAQGLTGIIVQIGAAQRALSAAPEEASSHLDLGQRMARESLAEARASVWNLRAPALSHAELIAAIRRLAAHPVRPDLQVTVEQRGELRRLPASVETALLRVCQEALTNVAKHSPATAATIRLDYGPEAVRLTVSDNGPGFDSYVLEHGGGAGLALGFGLQGMRERLGSFGGALTLRSDGGAQVEATVPYEQAGAPAREHA